MHHRKSGWTAPGTLLPFPCKIKGVAIVQSQQSSNGSVAGDIQRYLAEALLLGPSVGTSQPLFESGLIDSTGFVMIVSYMESRFGVVIDGDDLVPENFGTIDCMARLVESKRAAG